MLFDTNIFIYLEKQNTKAIDLIERTENIHISAITYMELIQGASSKNKARLVERLLQAFNIRILELNENISIIARLLIKQHAQSRALTLGDALIAATGIQSSLELVTANYRDFRYIDGLGVRKFTPSRQC
ncbi:type II toxin-antitoxin system VapC family toxin [Kineobactrum salinum]|uniref:Ribonuclease VapC n=1 Tax=Kineobactrum salinum TaxID=2708301 RepID=A0A6C0U142_9GAMM|nr:type II toxin-antitoxin system VapC family toxin [Kineobactrum salinum]QIB65503.1 type II toxin-antitoxin system VapC family toxin [Kineobactrum salinum]